jgi:hypothetical protein
MTYKHTGKIKVLEENNGNMLQTSRIIGCTAQLIRRHCVRTGLIQNSKQEL